MLEPDEHAAPGTHSERGRIQDVIYLGAITRYVIDLDAGGMLTAVRQNLETAASEATQERGREVSVSWREDQTFEIDPDGTENSPDGDQRKGREDP